ncbi:MAG: DUF4065 domain-containing protein [Bifidobacteriaceae bacterium]|nr:DUF4065 domain-containing protein [Bifidobacteriaceae bacterium]
MVTTSLDIAAWLVSHHDAETRLTNLSLNKLCFYAHVESLRNAHKTLFDDPIEAWRYGPVCPGVYRAYKRYGRNAIPAPATPAPRSGSRRGQDHGEYMEGLRLAVRL